MNWTKTAILLAAMTGLFVGIGGMLGGGMGMVIAFCIALAMNAFAYWNSDKMVLRMYGAQEIDKRRDPELFDLVGELSRRAQIPMPKIYVIDNAQPNAFATGRDPQHGAVAVTTGLRQRLSVEELAGVLAHELAHIKNRDTLTMTVTATIAGAISMLANFALFFGGERQPQQPPRHRRHDRVDVSGAASPPASFRWPSAAPANTKPTASVRKSRANRSGWPRRSNASKAPRLES